ncbi:unnamed protein product, partial [Mycena citricolor]
LIQRCRPPSGWPTRIGVANSGGSDSTCLLFLLNRYLNDVRGASTSRPKGLESRRISPEDAHSRLVSLTIDHDLQPSSAAMAAHCASVAKTLGVKHASAVIPWGAAPHPDKPQPGTPFETAARTSRYHTMFEMMLREGVDVLALGHHADDQVETSLMRLGKGSTEMGAGGMKRVRRWGMCAVDTRGELGFAGLPGMSRWMIRPLLDVSKDRILATCAEENLEYVTDSTNFQPELTIRNSIRKLLSLNTLDSTALGTDIPEHIQEHIDQIQEGLSDLELVNIDPADGPESVRMSVLSLTDQVEDIESEVDSCLNRCRLPSPEGTMLLSYRGLKTIHDMNVRRALILRITRYLSLNPWGSLRADGNRRRQSLVRIMKALWTPDPIGAGLAPFAAGGGVLWQPVTVGSTRIRFSATKYTPQPGDIDGWLVSRQPPIQMRTVIEEELENAVRVDITEQFRAKLEARDHDKGTKMQIMWDNRFLVTFDMHSVPDDVAAGILSGSDRLLIHPVTRWYWPKVLWQTAEPKEWIVLHSTVVSDRNINPFRLDRDTMFDWQYVRTEKKTADWIRSEWIRPLTAL